MKPKPKEKELNFNKIIESSSEGILIVDIEGVIRFANPSAHFLLNQKGADLIGKSFGCPLDDDGVIEMGIVRLNDKIGVGEMRLAETVWEGKKAYLVLLLDITELKHVQEDLRKINEELEARVGTRTAEIFRYSEELKVSNKHLFNANQELERFAYIASHDIQEPLRKIITYGNVLAGHESLDPNYKDYVERMTKSAQDLRHLVVSLLQFSRLPHEFSVEECDLNEIVKAVIVSLEVTLAQSKTVVSYSNLAIIQANKAQMSHLFQNLIENAIKFAQKDVSPHIAILSTIKPAGIEITVMDNGIGIEAQHALKIFEPFQRLNSKSDYAGSGIGLSIVKKIMENHNGSIRVEGALPRGCVFILTFPLAVPSLPELM